jgi:hypothetical protein
MADTDFEQQLHGLFDQAPAMADEAAFAAAVVRRIGDGARLRLALLGGFGVAGGLAAAGLSWSSFQDLGQAVRALGAAASGASVDWSGPAAWIGALALAGLGVALVRPALSEA